MRETRSLLVVAIFLVVTGVGVGLAAPARAVADGLEAQPFEFVGTADDCAPFPAGSRIVTSRWLGGMGLPDNGGANTTSSDLATNPNKQDPHSGLLLSKNGPTPDCSAAGAEIKDFGKLRQGSPTTIVLGFDYRNGGHCGAGAPRFNVVVKLSDGSESFHFVGGCSNATATPAPQDTSEWTRVRFDTSNSAQTFPVIPVGSKVKSITLIHDEGTDTANNDTQGVGLAVVDNIFISGKVITRNGDDNNDDADHDGDDD